MVIRSAIAFKSVGFGYDPIRAGTYLLVAISTQMFAGVDREVAHRAPQAEDIPLLLDVLARHDVKVEA